MENEIYSSVYFLQVKNTLLSIGAPRTTEYYRLVKKYEIIRLNDKEMLCFKRQDQQEKIVEIVPVEEYFSALTEVHHKIGHGKRDKMLCALKGQYYIPRAFVEKFVDLCDVCHSAVAFPRKGIAVKPIVSSQYLSRGQVDLVDFQGCPDGDYKWLMVYQDHLTKFITLRALKSKHAKPVAKKLFKIFSERGAPLI